MDADAAERDGRTPHAGASPLALSDEYPSLQVFRDLGNERHAARLLPNIRVPASGLATHHPDLQVKLWDGSDGTRTRDLRRDRPVFGGSGLNGHTRGSAE